MNEGYGPERITLTVEGNTVETHRRPEKEALMSTVARHRIDELFEAAESRGTCLVTTSERDRRAVRRRFRARRSDLISPAPGLYVRRDYWHSLKPDARALHMMRGIARPFGG